MTDHKNHETSSTPAPASSRAFPANVEPRGKTHFGPAPHPPRPSVGNVFNTDKHGKRKPGDR